MSINDQILTECDAFPIPETIDESKAAITRLIARAIRAESEIENLRGRLASANLAIEDLRAEALAWHARAESGNQITITCTLETARKLWTAVRSNPYSNPED